MLLSWAGFRVYRCGSPRDGSHTPTSLWHLSFFGRSLPSLSANHWWQNKLKWSNNICKIYNNNQYPPNLCLQALIHLIWEAVISRLHICLLQLCRSSRPKTQTKVVFKGKLVYPRSWIDPCNPRRTCGRARRTQRLEPLISTCWPKVLVASQM